MVVFHLLKMTLSVFMGRRIYVVMENNINCRRHEKLTSNAHVAERMVRGTELNRENATPAEVRRMLGVSETPSEYP
jgi:uncharacterized protein (DUF849 family)